MVESHGLLTTHKTTVIRISSFSVRLAGKILHQPMIEGCSDREQALVRPRVPPLAAM